MKSLKVTLTLWLSLLFLCVMLALAVGLGIQENRHTRQSMSVYLRQMTQVVSDMVREKQTGIYNYLSRVARQIPDDPKEAEGYIRNLGFSYLPMASSFYLLDKTGRITIVFRKSFMAFEGISLMNLEDVKSVIATHRPTISPIYISPFSGRRVISMNFPGAGKWILRVDIATDLFTNMVKNLQKAGHLSLYIFNMRGDVFEHPQQKFSSELAGMGLMTDRWREIKKATGHLLHFRFGGEEMAGVFMPLKPFGLIAGAVVPAARITREIFYSLAMLGGVGLVSLLALALVNFWMILHFVIQPIEEISSKVGRYEVGKGVLNLPPTLGGGFSELTLLVDKFNQMSGRIHMHLKEIARLESMIRNILDSSPAIIIALDPHGRIWYMNKSGETFFGTTSREVMGKNLRVLDPELEICEQRVKDVLQTSEPIFSRAQDWLRGIMVDRAIYPLISDGVEGIVVQWLDVSERYRAREIYRKRLEEIFSRMGDPIYVVNENYEIEIMNKEQARKALRRGDGEKCYSLIKGRDEVCPDCQFDAIKKGRIIRERIFNRTEGRYYDLISIPLFNEDNTTSKLTISRDVTEYVAIQEALKASEAAFRSLFEGAPVGMSVHQNGKFVMVNEAFGKIVGYVPKELIGASILKIIHSEDQGFVKERLQNIYQEGKLADVAHERYVRKDGTIAEVLVTGIPIHYRGKQAVHTVVIDLTEQIRLQTSLLRSEEFSAQILEKALDPILVLKPGVLEIVEANRPATRFFGVPYEELIGRNYLEFVSEEDFEKVKKNVELLKGKGSLIITERHYNLPGGRRIANLSVVRLKTPRGEDRSVVFIRDLTEFITLQKRLAQAQKQESLWQMAGGFAHDFNNLLAIMFGYIDMMELGHDVVKQTVYVRKLREISLRARDLVQNILLFSRENRGEQRPCTVNEVIFSSLNLVRPSLGSKIELKVEINNPHDMILVDVSQMVQVILNLAINARDAIGEKKEGTISIIARKRRLDKSEAKVLETVPGRYVEISVSDTGAGIPKAIQDKIFDPFFTTKSKGAHKGTGLGLAIVHSIVKNFKGGIELETSRKGTTFHILIPLEKEGTEDYVVPEKEMPVAGKGKILVVEDEHTLQILLQEMLEELGYEVVAAGDGIEAIGKLREGLGLDVVIMDLAMPKMGGEETMARMLEIRPDLKIIIMSGLVDDETQKRLREKGARAFVKKPVTISNLSHVINRVIHI